MQVRARLLTAGGTGVGARLASARPLVVYEQLMRRLGPSAGGGWWQTRVVEVVGLHSWAVTALVAVDVLLAGADDGVRARIAGQVQGDVVTAWRKDRSRWGSDDLRDRLAVQLGPLRPSDARSAAAPDSAAVLELLTGAFDALAPRADLRAALTQGGDVRTGALRGGRWQQRFPLQTLLGEAADRELVEAEVEALSMMLAPTRTRVPGRRQCEERQSPDGIAVRAALVAAEAILLRGLRAGTTRKRAVADEASWTDGADGRVELLPPATR